MAALPQVLLIALYLATNAHLTTYFFSHELSQFASAAAAPSSRDDSIQSKPRGIPLRITSGRPVGMQTTSLYLTLPRPWSWLLMFLFGSAAFLLSQALVVVTFTDPAENGNGNGNKNNNTNRAATGVMPGGLVGVLAVLVCIGLLVIGLGLRPVRKVSATTCEAEAGHGSTTMTTTTANPLVLRGGSCSAAISARAHPLPKEPDLAAGRLAWGAVAEGDGMYSSHAAFSAHEVRVLSGGMKLCLESGGQIG